ncbi:hypothetical protein CsatB_028519 [Cannabis sativa]
MAFNDNNPSSITTRKRKFEEKDSCFLNNFFNTSDLVDDGRTFQSSGTIKERENEREIWGFGVLEHWQNRAIVVWLP